MKKSLSITLIVGVALLAFWVEMGIGVAQIGIPKNFNHDATSFPLVGAHRSLQCSQCHLGGRYKSLPTTCSNCHNGQIAYGKPITHLMTAQDCDTCHTTSSWSPATFQHDLARVTGQCSTCHNGQKATGKPQNHIATTQQCDTCHRTTAWIPATFTHDASTAGQCSTCHNGQKATGKPQNHIATTQQCDTCHRTTAWIPAVFTNHDDPKLIGAHSTLDCKICHPQTFTSAFYRDGTQFGSCANCHTRDYKFPGPGDHKNACPTCGTSLTDALRTNAACSQCHKHASYRGF
jgi:hypothetical protein